MGAATFGSKHVAIRTCVEQIIDLRLTLRGLGIPIDGHSFILEDNEWVINAAFIPHSKLHNRHNALSYHCTDKAIVAGITQFHYIVSTTNLTDILSKHWKEASI